VKNNLQIIQSLLRLGSRDLKGDQREPFENAARRIGAMARVHTLLYNSPDLASIDFKEYLEGLLTEIADAFGADERNIKTVLEVEPMRIPLDTAVPLAFIAVEILTNAFKHAVPRARAASSRSAPRASATRARSRSATTALVCRCQGAPPFARAHHCDEAAGADRRNARAARGRRTTFRIFFPLEAAAAPPLPQAHLQPAA
jgi:hypothetical protein